MYVPRARERVFIKGRQGVFLVVWVSPEHEEVDLIPLHLASGVEECVPFSQLEPYRESIPLESR